MELSLSPQGKLYLSQSCGKHLDDSFTRGSGEGLLALDVSSAPLIKEPSFAFWKDFVSAYLSRFCLEPLLHRDLHKYPVVLAPDTDFIEKMILQAPSMRGAEYLKRETLVEIWCDIEKVLHDQIINSEQTVDKYFESTRPHYSLRGRICFHLAENKKSEETPFAFLITYAQKFSEGGEPIHQPLAQALQEYAKQKKQLLHLLEPIQRAANASPFLTSLVNDGAIYHPLRWSAPEAYQFLQDIPQFERAGIVVRVPNWWKAKHPPRPQVNITIGEKRPSGLGLNALVDFSIELTLGEEKISKKELQEILTKSTGLALIRGQWVELDKQKLEEVLNKWKKIEQSAIEGGGISLTDAMRVMAKVDTLDDSGTSWSRVAQGKWLSETLEQLRSPQALGKLSAGLKKNLKATLRPYQEAGVEWLYFASQLGLGVCLADDMGLGKTIQVLAHFLVKESKKPSLLVVPASLLGNWQSELEKFAPSLNLKIIHPSVGDLTKLESFDNVDLMMTTYGLAYRLDWLKDTEWDSLVLDEAQAIKNPGTKQTKAVKALKAKHRIALTGTPVENQLMDLWSIFDFLSPGLLGSSKELSTRLKETKNASESYAFVRKLVSPYILRRLKTDKSIIQDLPDKTEIKTYCTLSRTQVALYAQAVESLAREIKQKNGVDRKGLIFSYLMRFKQICNHPSHWLRDNDFALKESGKFLQLRDLAELMCAKQEKLLIFTQFQEMTKPLHHVLEEIFERPGLILHGETPVKSRKAMVDAFQNESGPPFFVLSLKAGGTGLNLTHASHVIHFDRWWNPAVENQATDRAFRIGQKKNVLVHKFICRGTLEEKIDAMIESKVQISEELLGKGGEMKLTELSNDELIKMVSLDLKSVANVEEER